MEIHVGYIMLGTLTLGLLSGILGGISVQRRRCDMRLEACVVKFLSLERYEADEHTRDQRYINLLLRLDALADAMGRSPQYQQAVRKRENGN